MRLQELAESAAGARDARHDGADGDIEDDGDVFVFDLFDVAEKKSFAELRLKLFERCVESGLIVETDEGVFRGGVGGGWIECFGMVFEEDGAGGGDAGAGGEEGVAEDAEDPGLEVGVGLKGAEGAEGFGEGLLHEVFGLSLILSEPRGVVVERGKEWERELLEGCAAVDGGRHGAECLGGSDIPNIPKCRIPKCGVAGVRRRGEEVRKGLGVEHPFR